MAKRKSKVKRRKPSQQGLVKLPPIGTTGGKRRTPRLTGWRF